MSNNIEELSYEDLVALCVRKQIDAIIQGGTACKCYQGYCERCRLLAVPENFG